MPINHSQNHFSLPNKLLFFSMIGINFVTMDQISNYWKAVTPQQAVKMGLPPMPLDLKAGYYAHGSWVAWSTIEQRPIVFAFLVTLFIVSLVVIWWKGYQWLIT